MNIETNDTELFRQISKDDEKAFEIIYKQHFAALCRYAYTYLKNAEESEEIAQEVFLNIWNRRKEIVINTSVKSYLYASVRNQALNYIKKQAQRKEERISDIHQDESLDETDNTNETERIEKQIFKVIDSLPEKCKEIFMLSRFENLKYKEIAEQLNISIKTVETQVSIALRKLRDSFNSD